MSLNVKDENISSINSLGGLSGSDSNLLQIPSSQSTSVPNAEESKISELVPNVSNMLESSEEKNKNVSPALSIPEVELANSRIMPLSSPQQLNSKNVKPNTKALRIITSHSTSASSPRIRNLFSAAISPATPIKETVAIEDFRKRSGHGNKRDTVEGESPASVASEFALRYAVDSNNSRSNLKFPWALPKKSEDMKGSKDPEAGNTPITLDKSKDAATQETITPRTVIPLSTIEEQQTSSFTNNYFSDKLLESAIIPAHIPLPESPKPSISSTQMPKIYPKRKSSLPIDRSSDIIEVEKDHNEKPTASKSRGLYETRKLSLIPKSEMLRRTSLQPDSNPFLRRPPQPTRKLSVEPTPPISRASISSPATSFQFIHNTENVPVEFVPIPQESVPEPHRKSITSKERSRFRFIVSGGKNLPQFMIENHEDPNLPASIVPPEMLYGSSDPGVIKKYIKIVIDLGLFFFPNFLSSTITARYNEITRIAWVQKVLLTILAMCIWGFFIFAIFAMSATCPYRTTWNYNDITQFTLDTNPYGVMIYGNLYNVSDALMLHKNEIYVNTTNQTIINEIVQITGKDVSPFFSPDYTNCDNIIELQIPKMNCSIPSIQKTYCHVNPDVSVTVDYLQKYLMGTVSFNWGDITNHPTRLVFSGDVLDFSFYLEQNVPFLGVGIDNIIRNSLGTDATYKLASMRDQVQCFIGLYKVGIIDDDPPNCLASEIILGFLFGIEITYIMGSYLLAAIHSHFITRNSKEETNKNPVTVTQGEVYPSQGPSVDSPSRIQEPEMNLNHIVMAVMCHQEDPLFILNTLESLALTVYSDRHKLILLIFDGTSVANQLIYIKLLLENVELHPHSSPNPHPVFCTSVGEESRKSNTALLYAGHYVKNNHRVPLVAIFKSGNSDENLSNQPGYRGIRDSYLMVMSFFHKVNFNAAMTPLEYDLFRKMVWLSGTTPDNFDMVLMLNGNVKVSPDIISKMTRYLSVDPNVIAVAANATSPKFPLTWKTTIQYFEYFLQNNYYNFIASLWGTLTVVPGHIQLYRIKSQGLSSKKGPVAIFCHPYLIEEFSQNKREELHKQILLQYDPIQLLSTLIRRCFSKGKIRLAVDAKCEIQMVSHSADIFTHYKEWYISRVHNLFEMIFYFHLNGNLCFSFQYLFLLDFIRILLQPVFVLSLCFPASRMAVLFLLTHTLLASIIVVVRHPGWVNFLGMVLHFITTPLLYGILPLVALWGSDDLFLSEMKLTQLTREKSSSLYCGTDHSSQTSINPMKFTDYEQERKRWEKNIPGQSSFVV